MALISLAHSLVFLVVLSPQNVHAAPAFFDSDGLTRRQNSTDDSNNNNDNNNSNNNNTLSPQIWAPLVGIAGIVLLMMLASCIRRRRLEAALQAARRANAAENGDGNTSGGAAQARRRRRRRPASQISTRSLPEYKEAPGDREVVLGRGQPARGDRMDSLSDDDEEEVQVMSDSRSALLGYPPTSPEQMSFPITDSSSTSNRGESLHTNADQETNSRTRPSQSFESSRSDHSATSDNALLGRRSSEEPERERRSGQAQPLHSRGQSLGSERSQSQLHPDTAFPTLLNTEALRELGDAPPYSSPITPTARNGVVEMVELRHESDVQSNLANAAADTSESSNSAVQRPSTANASDESAQTQGRTQRRRGLKRIFPWRIVSSTSGSVSAATGAASNTNSGTTDATSSTNASAQLTTTSSAGPSRARSGRQEDHARSGSAVTTSTAFSQSQPQLQPSRTSTSSGNPSLQRSGTPGASRSNISLLGFSRSSASLNNLASSSSSPIPPSNVSTTSISAPLAHTLVRTNFVYPAGENGRVGLGLSDEQVRFLSSRENIGKYAMPYGEEAQTAYQRQASESSREPEEPPPAFDFDSEAEGRDRPSMDSIRERTSETDDEEGEVQLVITVNQIASRSASATPQAQLLPLPNANDLPPMPPVPDGPSSITASAFRARRPQTGSSTSTATPLNTSRPHTASSSRTASSSATVRPAGPRVNTTLSRAGSIVSLYEDANSTPTASTGALGAALTSGPQSTVSTVRPVSMLGTPTAAATAASGQTQAQPPPTQDEVRTQPEEESKSTHAVDSVEPSDGTAVASEEDHDGHGQHHTRSQSPEQLVHDEASLDGDSLESSSVTSELSTTSSAQGRTSPRERRQNSRSNTVSPVLARSRSSSPSASALIQAMSGAGFRLY